MSADERSNSELIAALAHLRRGGVVAAATETFFGLLVDASKPSAIDELFRCKGRDASKGVALIIPGIAAWPPLVASLPPLALELARRFWPGPLTIAVAAARDLDPRLTVEGSIGVREPAASDAAELVRAFGAPLTATSANLAGEPPLVRGEDVERAFAGAEVLVLPGVARGGKPSTVVRVDGASCRVVREGAIDIAAVMKVAGDERPSG